MDANLAGAPGSIIRATGCCKWVCDVVVAEARATHALRCGSPPRRNVAEEAAGRPQAVNWARFLGFRASGRTRVSFTSARVKLAARAPARPAFAAADCSVFRFRRRRATIPPPAPGAKPAGPVGLASTFPVTPAVFTPGTSGESAGAALLPEAVFMICASFLADQSAAPSIRGLGMYRDSFTVRPSRKAVPLPAIDVLRHPATLTTTASENSDSTE